MREFLSLIIMPVPLLYLLLITAFILLFSGREKTAKIFLVVSAIWFLIISTLPVPRALVKSLENKYPQLSMESIKELRDSCNIIVLGGGHSDDKELSPNNQLSNTALFRLTEGIRIHRLVPGSKLVLSGYRGGSEISQATVLFRTALILGVDSASMIIQNLPSNTRMEAEEYARNFGPGKDPVVVTSDIHMPMAMILFKKSGLHPIAAPTDQILRNGSQKYRWRFIPSAGNIRMMEAAIHEYAGMIWTWIGGR